MNGCKVCGNTSGNKLHAVKEMQLGLREMFNYMECGNCGCMQLVDIPHDLGKYYPNEGYYSFNLGMDFRKKPDTLRKLKASYLIYGKNKLAGSLLSIGYNAPDYYSWIKNAAVQYNDAILDVGTGNGSLLLNLFKINAIKALFWSAVINGVVSVPVLVMMMLMTTRSDIMGRFVLPRYLKITGWIATAVMSAAAIGLFVTWGK